MNGVTNPGTVIVYAGNYPENVTVNKALTMNGPNANTAGYAVARAGSVRPHRGRKPERRLHRHEQ